MSTNSSQPQPTAVPDPHLRSDLDLLAVAVETGDASAWSRRLADLAGAATWQHRHLLVEHSLAHPAFVDGWLEASFQAAATHSPRADDDDEAEVPDDSVEIDPTALPHGCLTSAGTLRVRQVTAADEAQRHEQLDIASPLVQGALHAERQDPTAWGTLFDQARGLKADEATFRELLSAAAQSCPAGWAWQVSALETLSPWWYGTAASSYGLAEQLASMAPATRSELLPLVAATRAHEKDATEATEQMLAEALPRAQAYLVSIAGDEVELVNAANEVAARLHAAGRTEDAARALAPAGAAVDTLAWSGRGGATAHAEVLARAVELGLL
ncbi:hypothetical protein [Nocardioides bruguierae]|uniref:Uncharacterized protein n=1 Tax=Nocardioides bruguierae TaxID=2945102 RepID=A0A9X2IF96_9ACTN|nr:hypothetical protein [Nocardioides bruguierae]MCM0621591.1 hypothetical protein [Nocardioides bruguierae]